MVLLRQQLRLYLLRQLYQRYLQHRTYPAKYMVLHHLDLLQFLRFLGFPLYLRCRICLAK